MFKCQNQKHQFIALKEIHVDGLTTDQIRALENEVETIRNISHPNIVKYFGTQKIGDIFCIFLEFADKGSLRHYYQEHGPLDEFQASNCMAQVLHGLQFLHSKGIAHRDIKSANILLTGNGRFKLADFGASKQLEMQSLVSGLKGTPQWMAPEVIRGTQQSSGWTRADVWSVGCTAVEMMTASLPYAEYEHPMTAMYHIANGESPRFPLTKCHPRLQTRASQPLSSVVLLSRSLGEWGVDLSGYASLWHMVSDFVYTCCSTSPDDRPTVSTLLNHSFVSLSSLFPMNFLTFTALLRDEKSVVAVEAGTTVEAFYAQAQAWEDPQWQEWSDTRSWIVQSTQRTTHDSAQCTTAVAVESLESEHSIHEDLVEVPSIPPGAPPLTLPEELRQAAVDESLAPVPPPPALTAVQGREVRSVFHGNDDEEEDEDAIPPPPDTEDDYEDDFHHDEPIETTAPTAVVTRSLQLTVRKPKPEKILTTTSLKLPPLTSAKPPPPQREAGGKSPIREKKPHSTPVKVATNGQQRVVIVPFHGGEGSKRSPLAKRAVREEEAAGSSSATAYRQPPVAVVHRTRGHRRIRKKKETEITSKTLAHAVRKGPTRPQTLVPLAGAPGRAMDTLQPLLPTHLRRIESRTAPTNSIFVRESSENLLRSVVLPTGALVEETTKIALAPVQDVSTHKSRFVQSAPMISRTPLPPIAR